MITPGGVAAEPAKGIDSSYVIVSQADATEGMSQQPQEEPDPDFALEQNIPNPFRTKTEIHYEINEGGRVRLRVYDLLGRHVRTLVDAILEPDTYVTVFDGSALASGVYLYRLETPTGTESHRMTLAK